MTSQTHEDFTLYITNEKFYLAPVKPAQVTKPEILEIDRVNYEFNLIDAIPGVYGAETRKICALLGIVQLLSGPYLLVAREKKEVGMIDNHKIWEVGAADLIPFARRMTHLTPAQVRDNSEYESMIQAVIATRSFYYSHSYDITLSLQKVEQFGERRTNFAHLPLHERADTQFTWNGPIIRDLSAQPELRRFIVPVILGFVVIKKCTINNKPFTFVLISRRSIYRAGTRFFMRGIDTEGHVANFVETEQIAIHGTMKASFVQVRGSIPLFWRQVPELQYKPIPTVVTGTGHMSAIQKHFDELIANYGKVVTVSLIDEKGKEKSLGETFKNFMLHTTTTMKYVRYESFDFHKECRKMQWHKLSILINRLSAEQGEFKYYFHSDDDSSFKTIQTGVFRTNCIDCLDRTNVVQSMLARISLQRQLEQMGVLSLGEKVENHDVFESIFKNVWADNADSISIQYAGTKALKTDFTRTGKRSNLGALQDGINSSFRYIYNNFTDGFRQDSIDLFLGNHIVDRYEGISVPSPLRVYQPWRFKVLPLILLSLVAAFFLTLLMPAEELIPYPRLWLLIWLVASVLILSIIYSNGSKFVNYPRLNQRQSDKEKLL
ncbi:phosphatidylinositol-3-phosphatase SAC1-like [Dysidea avara]|uniref:phosphatidylinositol-3-phosphatase SAC1-like n=1 Tax=Dysidea avara TaxID=196820 RepID=UPI003322142B